jgi:hypothetical protein
MSAAKPRLDRVYIVASRGLPKCYIAPAMVGSWRRGISPPSRKQETLNPPHIYDLIMFDGARFYLEDSPGRWKTAKVSSEIFFYAMGLHYRTFRRSPSSVRK